MVVVGRLESSKNVIPSPSQLTSKLDFRLVDAGMKSQIRLTRVFRRTRFGHTISGSSYLVSQPREHVGNGLEMKLCDLPSLAGNPSIVCHVHSPSRPGLCEGWVGRLPP